MLKFSIEKAPMLASLFQAQAIVESNSAVPILSHVMIDADDGAVTLRTSDLDIETSFTVEATVSVSGKVCIPAKTLHEIVRKMTGSEPILFDLGEDGRLKLSCGRTEFDLPSLPAEDFPLMGATPFHVEFEMPAQDFRRLFDKTRFAVANEEVRYFLNGVYLHIETDEDGSRSVLRAVATDGHRLALAQTDAPSGSEDMAGVIVPRKTVLEMNRLLGTISPNVRISVSQTKIRMTMPGASITSKVVDGTFPPYQRIIPFANSKKLVTNGKSFGEVVDRLTTISSGKSSAVKMLISEDRIDFSVRTPENGSASEAFAVAYAHDPMEIGFNSKYLDEVASQVGEKGMEIYMEGSQSAILARVEGEKDALYVLMPMRV